MARKDGRAFDELRPVKITTDFVKFAEGSCLIECGDTKVLCCASVEDKTPPHVAEGEGWVTAEYSMLPRANRERSRRDIDKLKLSGRSAEIQRLIGRSLRAAVDTHRRGARTRATAGSAGSGEDELLLDLQYSEDSRAQGDLNCVMNELGEIVEVQGTGEGRAFTLAEQQDLLRLCAKGCRELRAIQRKALEG